MTLVVLDLIQIGGTVVVIIGVLLIGFFQNRFYRAQREFDKRIAERVTRIEESAGPALDRYDLDARRTS